MTLNPVVFALAVVLVIFVVVVVHESGHFVVAKLSSIRVDEFAVGFGPKLAAVRRGETTYSLRALPLGGYVRMPGMLGLEGEADAGERNFYLQSRWKRFATVAAGIVFNFIFAIVCFTVVDMAQPGGSWHNLAGLPLAAAGVPDGAAITSVDGMTINDGSQSEVTSQLRAAALASRGRPMQVAYRARDGHVGTASVKPVLAVYNPVQGSVPAGELIVTTVNGAPVTTGDPAALLGNGHQVTISGDVLGASGARTAFSGNIAHVAEGIDNIGAMPGAAWLLGVQAGYPGDSFPAAVSTSAQQIPRFVQQTFVGLYQLISGQIPGGVNGPNGLSGPVGIAQETGAAAANGFLAQNGLVWWIGFISMNLGLINVLPIPFLDGGKLFFILIEAVRRKRLNPRIEAVASAVGLALVVLIVIYVTIGDVGRL